MKTLIVAGTFADPGGKASKIGSSLKHSLSQQQVHIVNGGNLQDLDMALDSVVDFELVIWMPNVDNSIDKYLPKIKEINPKCLLVSSKRVVEKTYTEWDVVGRLLKTKSNLGIMITKPSKYRFRLLDPLGNLWEDTEDISKLGEALQSRASTLKSITRLPSTQLGDVRSFAIPEDYLEIVRGYGQEFHKYINAANPNRFLGNTATRCMSGFPAVRGDTTYFISKRNVEKGSITSSDFVEVNNKESQIEYYGPNKPSVDTPIQVRLFNFYRNVNYIVHGHVYVTGAEFTPRILPCGAIEEFEDIKSIQPFDTASNFAINLKGHGCLLLANNLDFLKSVPLESRPFPEIQNLQPAHAQ